MFEAHTYQGRHRAVCPPSHTTRNVVAIGTGVALSLAIPVTANATPSVPTGPPGGWDPIIQCETGNKNIENTQINPATGKDLSTASGYLQFVNGTWKLFGGQEFAPRAIDATRAEQIVVADRAYAANGLSDWEASRHCWQGKVPNASTAKHAKPGPKHRATTHVVKKGETLSSIAGTNWRAVFEANKKVIGEDPNLILPGQKLKL